MSGDPYVCPHGFTPLPICDQCPPPTGYMRMFWSKGGFSTGGNVIAATGREERRFATLDRIIRTLDRIDHNLDEMRLRR